MKRNRILLVSLLLLLTAILVGVISSCRSTPPETPPDMLESTEEGNGVQIPDDAPTVKSVTFPASRLPDYADYTTAHRIKDTLSRGASLAVTVGGTKYYANGELKAGGDGVVSVAADGTVTLDAARLGALAGKAGLTATTPEEAAKALGMGVSVYDHKLVLFFDGQEPFHTYEDLYTLESMHSSAPSRMPAGFR